MNIGVFFGSTSPEHDVSIITGQLIIAGLKKLNHKVVPVYIDKQGRWLIGEKLGELKYFTNPLPNPPHPPAGRAGKGEGMAEYYLDLEKSRGKLVFHKKGLRGAELAVDLAFPAFHGAYGEDGTVQGLFEMFHVPYVGCDVTSSAVTMDKILTKQLCVGQGIPTSKFSFFTGDDWQRDSSAMIERIEQEVKFPCFVKPARLGSSIGVAKAKDVRELIAAVEVALHYSERCLVEESVENLMDLTVSVLGNNSPKASLIQESVFGEMLFSYEDKYLNDGGAQLGKSQKNTIIPARLDSKIAEEIRAMAVKVFKLLGCSGIARVDFLYDKAQNKYFVSEANTLPGTLYHHLWQKSGVELSELLTQLLDLARERHETKKKIATTFESDLLKLAGSAKLRIKGDV